MTATAVQRVIANAITKELATYSAVTASTSSAELNVSTKGRIFEDLNHETGDDIADYVLRALWDNGYRIEATP